MTRLVKQYLVVLPKLTVLAIASMFINSLEAVAQSKVPGPDVTIVNTAANPVPVTGNLTGTVTITNTPNVNVTNTPNVTVTNQVTVRDADNAGRNAVTIQFSSNTTSGSGTQFWQSGAVYTVPAGKRLVIEDFDAEVFATPATNSGGVRGNLRIFNGLSGVDHPQGSTTIAIPCTLSQTCFSLSRLSRLYADAGSTLWVDLTGNLVQSGGFHFGRGTINGYLISVP
jgi:hypothetical protein